MWWDTKTLQTKNIQISDLNQFNNLLTNYENNLKQALHGKQ